MLFHKLYESRERRLPFPQAVEEVPHRRAAFEKWDDISQEIVRIDQ